MFARLFAIASLAALAVAGPARLSVRGDTCSTGEMYCCNSMQDANTVQHAMGPLGLVNILAGLTGQVGLGCSPITVVGVGSSGCTAQTVCCTDNQFNGLINAGCNNINL